MPRSSSSYHRHVRCVVAAAVAVCAFSIAPTASAAVVTVLPGDPTWFSIPGENSANGSTTIDATVPRNGNGSLELIGDRTRFSMGNYFSPASTLGLASTVTELTFDWRVASDSSNPYNPDYTPALRLHLRDNNGQRSELIWEGAYNGVYGNESKDTWYTTGVDDLFYQNVSGVGVTLNGQGAQINQTLTQWLSSYSSLAYVNAISVGDGSGASGAYHAFVDDVTLGISGGVTTYDFEASAAAAAVPEPAAIGLLGIGLVGLLAMRRRSGSAARPA